MGGKLGSPDLSLGAGRLGYVCRQAAYPNPPAQRGNWWNSSLAAYSIASAPLLPGLNCVFPAAYTNSPDPLALQGR